MIVCLLSDSKVLGMNTIKTVFRKCRYDDQIKDEEKSKCVARVRTKGNL